MNAYDKIKHSWPLDKMALWQIGERGSHGDNNIFIYAATSQGGLYNPIANVYNLIFGIFNNCLFGHNFCGNPILDVAVNPSIKLIPPGRQNYYVEGQAIPTPEPGTMLLLGLGLIGIGIVMRELF